MIKINTIFSCAKIVPAGEFGEFKFIAMAPWFFCPSGSSCGSGQNRAAMEQSIFAVWSGVRCPTGTAGRVTGATGFVPGINSPLMGKCNQITCPLNYCSLGQKQKKKVLPSCNSASGPWDIQDGGNGSRGELPEVPLMEHNSPLVLGFPACVIP